MADFQQQSDGRDEERQGSAPAFTPSESPEEKLRIMLRKRIELGDDAQLLSESVHGEHGAMHGSLRFLLFLLIVVFPLCVAGYFVFLNVVIPRWVNGLSASLLSPQDSLPVYKRIVQGTLDYSPPVSTNQKTAGIADIPQASSLAFSNSTTIIPHKAMEGVFRMNFGKSQLFTTQSDVEVQYKLLWTNDKSSFKFFFLPSRWPGQQNTADVVQQWSLYESQLASSDQPGQAQRLPVEDFFGSFDSYRQLLLFLWNKGLQTGDVAWHIDSLTRRHTSGSWVTDATITLDEKKTRHLLSEAAKDPLYETQFKTLLAQKIKDVSVGDLLQYLVNAKGTVTIGTFNHLLYDTAWTLDFKNDKFGASRLALSTTVAPLLPSTKITTPTEVLPTSTVIPLVNSLEGAIATSTISSIESGTDADGDKISDHDEKILGTDPVKKDTDDDGYSDLEEIQKGYNPLGT